MLKIAPIEFSPRKGLKISLPDNFGLPEPECKELSALNSSEELSSDEFELFDSLSLIITVISLSRGRSTHINDTLISRQDLLRKSWEYFLYFAELTSVCNVSMKDASSNKIGVGEKSANQRARFYCPPSRQLSKIWSSYFENRSKFSWKRENDEESQKKLPLEKIIVCWKSWYHLWKMFERQKETSLEFSFVI